MIEKVSLPKRRMTVELSEGVDEGFRKRFANWNEVSGRRFSFETQEAAAAAAAASAAASAAPSMFDQPVPTAVPAQPQQDQNRRISFAMPFVPERRKPIYGFSMAPPAGGDGRRRTEPALPTLFASPMMPPQFQTPQTAPFQFHAPAPPAEPIPMQDVSMLSSSGAISADAFSDFGAWIPDAPVETT